MLKFISDTKYMNISKITTLGALKKSGYQSEID